MNEFNNIYKEILNKIDIVDIIQHYLPLTQKGKNYVGLCPFHDDTNPSLFVSPNHQLFNCFSCNTKGNVFSFVQKFKKKNYKEAVIEVCEIANVDPSLYEKIKKQNEYANKFLLLYETNDLVSKLYKYNLFSSKIARSYLQQRNVSDDLIKRFHLGYASDDYQMLYKILIEAETDEKLKTQRLADLITVGLINKKDTSYQDFFKNRIIFPIRDEYGNIVGFSGRSLKNDSVKYLNIPETSIFKKHECLYNINNVYNSDITEIYILEGYMDVISLAKININNCIALMGVTISEFQINLLKKITKLENIILSLDNDDAGTKALLQLAPILLKNNFNVFFLDNFPKNCKDMDEAVNTYPEKKVKEILHNRINYFEFLTNYHIKENKNLTIDVKQKISNIVLQEIKNYADSSVVSLHIEKLSKQINIPFVDLKNKFDELNKNIKKNQLNSNFGFFKINKKNTFNVDEIKNIHEKNIEKISSNLFDYECLCIAYLCYGINNIFDNFVFEYDFFNQELKYIFNVLLNIINNKNEKNIDLKEIEQIVLNKKENNFELKNVWEIVKKKIKSDFFLVEKVSFKETFNKEFIKNMVDNLVDKRLTFEFEELLLSAEKQQDQNKANELKQKAVEILKIKQNYIDKKNK